MTKQITPPRRRELAAKVGVHEQYLYQCLTGRRDMNPTEARRIETDTDGELSRQMLCQKTWHGIWPELTAIPAEDAARDTSKPEKPAEPPVQPLDLSTTDIPTTELDAAGLVDRREMDRREAVRRADDVAKEAELQALKAGTGPAV